MMAEKLPEVPELLYSVIKQAEKGRSDKQRGSEDLKAIREEIKQANRRTVLAILASAMLILIGLVLFQ